MISRLTVTTCQLSVENAIAMRAAATNENMEAKHNVTALQHVCISCVLMKGQSLFWDFQ